MCAKAVAQRRWRSSRKKRLVTASVMCQLSVGCVDTNPPFLIGKIRSANAFKRGPLNCYADPYFKISRLYKRRIRGFSVRYAAGLPVPKSFGGTGN